MVNIYESDMTTETRMPPDYNWGEPWEAITWDNIALSCSSFYQCSISSVLSPTTPHPLLNFLYCQHNSTATGTTINNTEDINDHMWTNWCPKENERPPMIPDDDKNDLGIYQTPFPTNRRSVNWLLSLVSPLMGIPSQSTWKIT